MTKHVVTRWYRAPELPLYNDGDYDTNIDMWSVGCCFAEMLGMMQTGPEPVGTYRKALFPGGSCFPMSRNRDGQRHLAGAARDQLNVIFDVLGTPDDATIEQCRTQGAKDYIRSLPRKAGTPLASLYPASSPEAIQLLQGMLAFHPHQRISVDDALAHPFLASIRRPADEVSFEHFVPFERITKAGVRAGIVDEIRHYNEGAVPEGWQEGDPDSFDMDAHCYAREVRAAAAAGGASGATAGAKAAGHSSESKK
ncbi:MPK3 [Symbiodinium sp. KB8]|nr:MPK3 [Symbiodinium sp. KB8]